MSVLSANREPRALSGWPALTLIIFSAGLQACIPLYLPRHQAIPLSTPKNLSNTVVAQKGVGPITVLRETRAEADHDVTAHTKWAAGGIGGYSGAVIIVGAEHTTFTSSEDPDIWAADSFAEALRDAGYQVESVENLANARTPAVIVANMTDAAVERDSLWTLYEKARAQQPYYRPKCNLRLHLAVKVFIKGEPRFERTFEAKSSLWPLAANDPDPCDTDTVTKLVVGGLGEAINQAVPTIAPVLNETSRVTGTPAQQLSHPEANAAP